MMMTRVQLEGISASPGLASGAAFLFRRPDLPVIDGPASGVDTEIGRLQEAARGAVSELVVLKETVRHNLGDEFAHIFRSQQTIAEDDSILGEVEALIREEELCAEAALRQVFDTYRALFDELDDGDYNKGRAADIDDVYKRIMRNLLGIPDVNLADLAPETIVVAEELYPSDTALMDASRVAGIVTERGGATSHVAILAKNLGIPAAVRVEGALERIRSRDTVVLDVSAGEQARIFVNPDQATREMLEKRDAELRAHIERVAAYRGARPVTPDGRDVTLSANVGSTNELEPARVAGAESIGLYRSEFLFMNSAKLPDEERQYEAYRAAAEAFRDGFVIIRTLDVGGDKQVPSIPMPHEDNPFLGNRALRLCLSRPELFRTQLRAILRASATGTVKMMFPMVGGVPELDRALGLLEDVREELDNEGYSYDPNMEVGIMIEIPSAVWVADALAQRVSFFSIGTNDLTQYLTAADRMNGAVQEYNRAYDPSVFRAIAAVAAAAERHGRWTGVCGELGGDPLAIPALIGLGITELSMTPRAITEATWLVRSTPYAEAQSLANRVLSLDDHTEIRALLEQHYASKE